MKTGKVIVISAPSGTGKSTIIHAILDRGELDLQFSVSATNRAPRPGEVNGESYHFLSNDEFKEAIANDEFIEWEKVYPGRYYGTLKSEVTSKTEAGHNIVLDIDVKGALNVKKLYGEKALTLFVMPPSIAALQQRLEHRGTEAPEIIAERVARAEFEISLAPEFDAVVVNDELQKAIEETNDVIKAFIN